MPNIFRQRTTESTHKFEVNTEFWFTESVSLCKDTNYT